MARGLDEDFQGSISRFTVKFLRAPAERELVSDLRACFAREGITDVCDFVEEELTAESALKADADYLLIFLSSSVAPPLLIGKINEHSGRPVVLPIAVDRRDLISGANLKIQFLPSTGTPITEWRCRPLALRNISRSLRNDLREHLPAPDSEGRGVLSRLPTRGRFWSITHLLSWMGGSVALGIVGGFAAVRLGGDFSWPVVLLFLSLLWLTIPVGVVVSGLECGPERWYQDGYDRLFRVLRAVPRLLLGLALTWLVLFALAGVEVALRGGRPLAGWVRWVDLGVIGGAVVGGLLYAVMRRKSPVLFHPTAPPSPESTYVAWRGRVVDFHFPWLMGGTFELRPLTVCRAVLEWGCGVAIFWAAFELVNPKLRFGRLNYSLGLQAGLIGMCLASGLYVGGLGFFRRFPSGRARPWSARWRDSGGLLRDALLVPVRLSTWTLPFPLVEILTTTFKVRLDGPIFMTLFFAGVVFLVFRLPSHVAGWGFMAREHEKVRDILAGMKREED